MKNATIKIISLLLASSALFATACKGGDGDSSSNSQDFVKEYFVENGESTYKVLMPENADETVQFAAQELIENVQKATGATLPIITDVENIPEGKYISLGNTSLLRDSEVQVAYSELGKEGYKIQTIGDDVVLAGTTSDAVLYAVYGFLGEYFDYRYYYKDVIRLTKTQTVELLDLNVTDVPAIGTRASGTEETEMDATHRQRLRLHRLYDGWGALYAHTYFKIVNPEDYKAEHENWYSPDGTNLCLSNVDRDVFTDNLKEYIEATPGSPFMMIGQEDTFTFCDCDDCTARIEEWVALGATTGAGTSALMMEFSNDIATRIDQWIKAEHPERSDFRLVTFSYNATRNAPCTENKTTGEWTLLDNSLKAVSNLSVMVVPYNAVMNYPFIDEANDSAQRQFESWSKVTDSMFVWMYDFNFDHPIQGFYGSFGTWAENYKFYDKYGVEWVYVERSAISNNNRGINFENLKDFVSAELAWDHTQNVEDLIDEFMVAYYQDAALPMKNLLDALLMKQAEYAAHGHYLYTYGIDFETSGFYSYGFLQETCMGYVAEAYKAIEKYKTLNGTLYEALYERITLETFYIRYLLVKIYPYEYQDVEKVKEELVAEMRKYGVGTAI